MTPFILIILFSLTVGEDRLDVHSLEFNSLDTCEAAGRAAKAKWQQDRAFLKLEIGYLCLEK